MSNTPTPLADDQLMLRIYGEYLEMPCLRLTSKQARRLFGLAEHTCAKLLDALVAHGLLTCQPNGMYVLAASADVASFRRAMHDEQLRRTA